MLFSFVLKIQSIATPGMGSQIKDQNLFFETTDLLVKFR